MVVFYGYNDGRAIAVYNRKKYLNIAFYSFIFVGPSTIIGILTTEYLWFLSWTFPLCFFLLALLTFFFIKYDDKVFLKGAKKKHLFKVEDLKIFKDGKEIKKVNEIRLYKRKNYLFMETENSFFRIPDNEYQVGSRSELLQTVIINKNHSVWFRLLPKTYEEKVALLFKEIDVKDKCRLFCSKDKERIAYIYKRNDGFFSIGAERMVLVDDDELDIFKTYGWWEHDNVWKSVFETEEMAYNEIKNMICDYQELKIE